MMKHKNRIMIVLLFLLLVLYGCDSSIDNVEKKEENLQVEEVDNENKPIDSIEDSTENSIPVSIPIYKVQTLVELHVRTGPGTNYSISYTLPYGSVVSVYEKKDDGTYLWSRISENEWVADDGTWLKMYDETTRPISDISEIPIDQGDHGRELLGLFLDRVKGYWHYSISGVDGNNVDDYEYLGKVIYKGVECYKWSSPVSFQGYNGVTPIYDGAYLYIEKKDNPNIYCDPIIDSVLFDGELVWTNGSLNITYNDEFDDDIYGKYIKVAMRYLKESGYFDWKSDYEGSYYPDCKYYEHVSYSGLGYYYNWCVYDTDLGPWNPPSDDHVLVCVISHSGPSAGYSLTCFMRYDGEHYYMTRLSPDKIGFIPEGEEIIIE